MASDADIWYIRLPDGRVLRARSTEALRRFLKTGKIPWESRVRRSSEAPWQMLDAVEAFAGILPPGGAPDDDAPAEAPTREADARQKARTPALDLRPLGMRGLVEELFNAFDSCLQHAKLTTAACTGLGIGVTLIVGDGAVQLLPHAWVWTGYVGGALVLLVLFSICTSILTQMTALELSRLRPARFSEIRADLLSNSIRLIGALGLVGGALAGLIVLLRLLSVWLAAENPHAEDFLRDALLNIVDGARLIMETICWPIFGVATLLMGPTLIVEEYSIARGMREWLGMLKQHLGRIYLYQAIAFALAAVMTLPLLIPVLLAFGFAGGNPRTLSLGESVPFYLLLGVSLTPMLAYLLVAHVFIYLNLRYEFFYSARER